MIKNYKKRELLFGKRYQLYRNLNRQCFSVRNVSKRLVVAHVSNLLVTNSKLVVSALGKQKVIDTNRKNVHAYIEGKIEKEITKEELLSSGYVLYEVTYCPYTLDSFVLKDTGLAVHSADTLFFGVDKVFKVVKPCC